MPDIIVELNGGLIQDVSGLPKGWNIVVRDYDVEGADEDDLETDEDGEYYSESWWEGDVENAPS